jgi:hypothetical protein
MRIGIRRSKRERMVLRYVIALLCAVLLLPGNAILLGRTEFGL